MACSQSGESKMFIIVGTRSITLSFFSSRLLRKWTVLPWHLSAKVEEPSIWDHKTRSKAECVNETSASHHLLVHQVAPGSGVSVAGF